MYLRRVQGRRIVFQVGGGDAHGAAVRPQVEALGHVGAALVEVYCPREELIVDAPPLHLVDHHHLLLFLLLVVVTRAGRAGCAGCAGCAAACAAAASRRLAAAARRALWECGLRIADAPPEHHLHLMPLDAADVAQLGGRTVEHVGAPGRRVVRPARQQHQLLLGAQRAHRLVERLLAAEERGVVAWAAQWLLGRGAEHVLAHHHRVVCVDDTRLEKESQ